MLAVISGCACISLFLSKGFQHCLCFVIVSLAYDHLCEMYFSSECAQVILPKIPFCDRDGSAKDFLGLDRVIQSAFNPAKAAHGQKSVWRLFSKFFLALFQDFHHHLMCWNQELASNLQLGQSKIFNGN